MRYLSRINLSGSRGMVRRGLGWTFFSLGVIGAILPLCPGWPAFILAIVLLGRRDRTLRLTHLVGRRMLRRMRRARNTVLRQIGRRLSTEYVRGRRLLTPAIISMERMIGAA